MADWTVTPTNVVLLGDAQLLVVPTNDTVVQGDVMFRNSGSTSWGLASCDLTAVEAGSLGLAICVVAGGADGYCAVVTRGAQLGMGQTLTKTDRFCVSTAPGGIMPIIDLVSTNFLSDVGYASGVDVLELELRATGIQQ